MPVEMLRSAQVCSVVFEDMKNGNKLSSMNV